jgi:hypothetical protein
MTVDTRLLSYWTQAQATRTGERDSERWDTSPAVPDALTELLDRIEQLRTPLHAVPLAGPR